MHSNCLSLPMQSCTITSRWHFGEIVSLKDHRFDVIETEDVCRKLPTPENLNMARALIPKTNVCISEILHQWHSCQGSAEIRQLLSHCGNPYVQVTILKCEVFFADFHMELIPYCRNCRESQNILELWIFTFQKDVNQTVLKKNKWTEKPFQACEVCTVLFHVEIHALTKHGAETDAHLSTLTCFFSLKWANIYPYFKMM